ncbi:MAG TPA: permease [Phycisphaerae bacterium]|nr:permease [Phycisphaerae bacterium]
METNLECCPVHEDAHGPQSSRIAHLIQGGFVIAAFGMMVFLRDRSLVRTLSITFISIVLEALPFMLLGTLLGGLIEVFVPREKLAALMPKRRAITVLIGAALGAIFPTCECAIVPVVRSLLRKGVPLGAAVAYLLGGPIVNPLVAASTAVAYSFNWPVVVIRVLFGYGIAVAVGFWMDWRFKDHHDALLPAVANDADVHCCCHGRDHLDHHDGRDEVSGFAAFRAKLASAIDHAADEFFDIGRFMIIGAFLAALLQTLVARQTFVAAIAGTPALAVLLMMGLAVSLNLCSEADAFVAASFRATVVPLSAQMAFMVLGPMLDIKLLLMYLPVFRRRAIVMLAAATTILVFVSMVIMGVFWK